MDQPVIEFMYIYKFMHYYKIYNHLLDEEVRAIDHEANDDDIKRWIQEFNKRYYKSKYLIACYTVDNDERCVGVWDNIEQMSQLTKIPHGTIACMLCKRKKTNIIINGIRCKMYLINVYGED